MRRTISFFAGVVMGGLVGATVALLFAPDSGTELGEMLLGIRPGRVSDTEITVYKAMGIAMEDMVAANLAYERANQEGVGAYIVL